MKKRWPVTVDDDGIRPAGRPDECFYCDQRIGENHLPNCVTIVVDTTYGVYYKGRRIGTYRVETPRFWDNYRREMHKSRSTWCQSNLADDASGYEGEGLPDPPEGECHCGMFTFEVEETGKEHRSTR